VLFVCRVVHFGVRRMFVGAGVGGVHHGSLAEGIEDRVPGW